MLYILILIKVKMLFQLIDFGVSMFCYVVFVEELVVLVGLFIFVLLNVFVIDVGYYVLGYDVQFCRINYGVVFVVNGKNDKFCICVFIYYIYKNEVKVFILFYFYICV